MKLIRLFEDFDDEFYEEITSPEFSIEKNKALFIEEEGGMISKKSIEEYCGIITKRKDFDRKLPVWITDPSMKNYTELQITFSADITHKVDKSNIRIAELRDVKLVLDVEIDIRLLPEEYFLVRFYSEPKKGNHRYFKVKEPQVNFYKCDQLEGLKYLMNEIYHSYRNKRLKN